jgi:hypothetical protein
MYLSLEDRGLTELSPCACYREDRRGSVSHCLGVRDKPPTPWDGKVGTTIEFGRVRVEVLGKLTL